MSQNNFGKLLKSLRIGRGLTLREFSRIIEKDVGNMSKMERGLIPPPKDERLIREYGYALGLNDESSEMGELVGLGAIECGLIPREVLDDEELMAKLPLFFRTITGSKLGRDQLTQFIERFKQV